MPTYHLRVAWREPNGVIRAPACDEPLEAPCLRDAIAVALASPHKLLHAGTNLAWLIDPEGRVAWTLPMDEGSAVAL